MSLRLLMMGTGTFALPTFLKLCESSHEVVGLVTQPDRTGRGHHRHVNEMKQAALEREIPVFQPASANREDALERLREFRADVMVVAAYGQILSSELLAIPPLGAINVHASLLPKYRGAAPIVYAILHGEAETGVTIFRIEPKLDAGPVLGMASTSIGPKETAGELEERLAELAPSLTIEVLGRMEAGTTEESTQDASLVSTAPRLRKEQGAIDWSQPSHAVDCHIRAMQPWPKPFTFLHSEGHPPTRLLVLDVDPVDAGSADAGLVDAETADVGSADVASLEASAPGLLVSADEQSGLLVRTMDGAVRVNRLQPAGKRPMSAADFLRGNPVRPGDRFGSESS